MDVWNPVDMEVQLGSLKVSQTHDFILKLEAESAFCFLGKWSFHWAHGSGVRKSEW